MKNRETQLVYLWLTETYDHHNLVEQWNHNERKLYRREDRYTTDVIHFSTYLRMIVEESNPLGESASLFSDLLGAALCNVNWVEIAQTWLDFYLIDNPTQYEFRPDSAKESEDYYIFGSAALALDFWSAYRAIIQDVIDNSTEDQNSVTIIWKSHKPSGIYITL